MNIQKERTIQALWDWRERNLLQQENSDPWNTTTINLPKWEKEDRKFWHHQSGRTPDNTGMKVVKERKSKNWLGYRKSIPKGKESTKNHYCQRRRSNASRTSTMGPRDQPNGRSTIENGPHIQNVRSRAASSKRIHQQELMKEVYPTILFKV